MTPVKSTSLHSVGYDQATKTMTIKFRTGGVYQYANVSPDQNAKLMSAASVGNHFHTFIAGKFKATKQ